MYSVSVDRKPHETGSKKPSFLRAFVFATLGVFGLLAVGFGYSVFLRPGTKTDSLFKEVSLFPQSKQSSLQRPTTVKTANHSRFLSIMRTFWPVLVIALVVGIALVVVSVVAQNKSKELKTTRVPDEEKVVRPEANGLSTTAIVTLSVTIGLVLLVVVAAVVKKYQWGKKTEVEERMQNNDYPERLSGPQRDAVEPSVYQNHKPSVDDTAHPQPVTLAASVPILPPLSSINKDPR